MGLGAVAALGANRRVQKAEAVGNTTVYCKMTYSWWTDAGAAIGVHYWGGSTSGTSWPGIRGAAVETDTGVWKFSVPSDVDGFQFTRVNGDGEISDWGAKTGNLAFVDGKNLYTITSSSAVWGNPGVTGEWSAYEEPAVASKYYVKVNSGEFEELQKNNATEYRLSADRAFAAGDVLSFKKDSEAKALTVKPDGGFSSNNVALVGGQLKIVKAATANLYWDVSSDSLWVSGYGDPVDGKAYLVGSFNSWGGIKTVGTTEDDENYLFSGVVLEANAQLKAFKYNAAGADDDAKHSWINVSEVSAHYPVDFPAEEDGESHNVKVTRAGTYDIKVNSTNGSYEVIPTANLPEYTMVYNNLVGEPIAMPVDEAGMSSDLANQHSAILTSAAISRPVKFYKDGVEITSDIKVTGDSRNSGICGDATNGFRVHNSYDGMKVYLKQEKDGKYEIWANHYDVSGLYIDSAELSYDGEYSGDYYEQYYLASASYTAGQQIGASTANRGYSIPLAVEAVAGNNLYTDDGKIYVHNDYTGILYAKRNYDGTFYLWLGGYEVDYSLTIGGVERHMTKVGENSYKLEGIALTAGQAITCKREGAAQVITAEAVGNNNLQSDGVTITVLADAASADVYLNTSANTLWVGGLGLESASGWHLLINNPTSGKVTFLKMEKNGDKDEYYSAAHQFKQNDQIKIAYCNSASALPVIYNPGDGLDEFSDNHFEVNGSGVVVCTADALTNAYIKLSEGHDKLYFGTVSDVDVVAAINFVTDFKAALATACSETLENRQTEVEAAWSSSATAFGELSEGAKSVVDLGGYSQYDDIKEFATRYISMLQTYDQTEGSGTWTLANFMNWVIPAASQNIVISNRNNSVSNTALVVVLASAITVILAGGLFLVIRRRRNVK